MQTLIYITVLTRCSRKMACEHGHDHSDGSFCPSCLLLPVFLFVWYYFLQPILSPLFMLNVWNPIRGIKEKVDQMASEKPNCCGKSNPDEAADDEIETKEKDKDL